METREQGFTHSPEGEGKKVWMVGTDFMTFKATSDSTGGAFALFDTLVLPGGGEASGDRSPLRDGVPSAARAVALRQGAISILAA